MVSHWTNLKVHSANKGAFFCFCTTFWEAGNPDVIIVDAEVLYGGNVLEEDPGNHLIEGLQTDEATGESGCLAYELLVHGVSGQLTHFKV